MSVPPKIRTGDSLIVQGSISYIKLKPTAEAPFKENIKDIGYEITVIERLDNRADDVYGDVNMFSTGLILNAPKHYHVEVIEHPALHKAGYMLVGGPRIINPENTEELLLPLYKYKEVEDIELPFRVAVIVLRETEYCNLSADVLKKGYDRDREEDRYQDDRRAHSRAPQVKSARGGLSSSSLKTPKSLGKGGNHMF